MYLQNLLVALVSFVSVGISAKNELARGFNDDIDWHSFEEGLEIAKEQNKPIFLLIHKTWCGACKALKPRFAVAKEIETLSENFVMINCQDDEEPKDEQYSPDGGYIPRILFLDPEGKVQKKIINEDGNPQFKYFYPSPGPIEKSMKKASTMDFKEEL